MKIKIIKPCVVGGKPVKASNKHYTVTKEEGDVLVSLGRAVDLDPKPEEVTITMDVNVQEVEAVKAQLEEKDATIAKLTEELEAVKAQLEEKAE